MSLGYHCDRDGCDTWVREDTDLPVGFVTVFTHDGDTLAHCCGLDCLMYWAAGKSAPTEVVENA